MRLTAPVAPWLDRYRQELLGDQTLEEIALSLVRAEECFFAAASAGLVLGLRLDDGTRVALKVMRSRPGLAEAVRIQSDLYTQGFPCPRPLLGPVERGSGSVAVVQEWVEAPQRDLHDPALRRTAATLPAELVRITPRVEGLAPAFAGARDPFPPPHDSRFDLRRPDGAWIDALAARVLPGLEAAAANPVVGHSDWSAKHFGWNGDRVSVVYDWPDSVALDAEETIVGQASATFPATWDLPIDPKLATSEESEAFVEEYEESAGKRLDRELVAAARLYVIAYSARCELSDLGGADGPFQRRLRCAL